jgi:hypothetical protein
VLGSAARARRPRRLLATFALSATYAIVIPPFQVADEPSHFQVLTDFIGRPLLAQHAESWARRTMFEEIRFHPFRTFSPLDRGATGQPASLISVPARDLYGALRAVWRPVAPLVKGMDLPRVFLTVRLFHAAIFAFAVGIFVLLVHRFTGSPAAGARRRDSVRVRPGTAAVRHARLELRRAARRLHRAGRGARDRVLGWPSLIGGGAGSGLRPRTAIGISRSALPLVPFIACVLAARAVLGDRAGRRSSAWLFWGGFTLTLACMLTLIREPFTDELDVYGALVSARATAFTVLLRQPLLLLPFGAAGLMSEHLLTRLRRSIAFRPPPDMVSRAALYAAGGLCLLLSASLLVDYPVLPLYTAPTRPPTFEYVLETVFACVTFLRFGRPDWLTSVTFFAASAGSTWCRQWVSCRCSRAPAAWCWSSSSSDRARAVHARAVLGGLRGRRIRRLGRDVRIERQPGGTIGPARPLPDGALRLRAGHLLDRGGPRGGIERRARGACSSRVRPSRAVSRSTSTA